MYGYGWPHLWTGFGIFNWLPGILIWVLLIALIIGIFRHSGSNRHEGSQTSDSQKTPLDILKERYAKGEIDKQEFETKKKDLS